MIVITKTRFSWVSGLCLKLLEQWGERSVALTATLRSFLISSPKLTPKESCLVMNPATRNHRVAVWKNDKVANFFQTSWALLLQARFGLKWSLILNNWNLMKNVLCGFANIFELVIIALNELRNDFKIRNFTCKCPEILKRTS